MSLYGSQRGINTVRRAGSRGDLNAASSYPYARGEAVVQRGSNGFGQEMVEGFGQTFSRGSMSAGQVSSMASVQQRVTFLQHQCQELLDNAAFILKTAGDSHSLAEADRCLAMAADMTEQLKGFAVEFSQQNLPADSLIRSVNDFSDQLRDLGGVLSSAVPVQPQKWSTRSMRRSVSREEAARFFSESGTLAREETSRFFVEAVAWITQQKRLIETAQWGDDLATVEQQIISHNAFHSSIQRSTEVERARSELMRLKDQNPEMNKPQLNRLEQEWDALQRSSHQRSTQLQELHAIIQQISSQIMWVNEREEEELLFDWGDRNIDIYIPQKQERFSKLMTELEQKEVDLNQLKGKVDVLLKNKHPASDKIQAYMETLQTQWSWLLQITKCIEVHLKENARYSQFFKETMEMNGKLQKEHDNIRKSFSCDKTTPLPRLLELQQGLESERERLAEQKETVQQLVLKAKSIIRLKPRNPEEKISGQNVRVQALCDFRQDERTMRRGDEGIVGDNSERSTWLVRGPGGLDMQVPSVCLTLLPPNPLAISLANKNSQYYEAILSVWNQLYINVKSSISWQYCLLDINRINSLTISMLSKMGPEEMSSLIRSLELHYQEFEKQSAGSELFATEERRLMETQITGAQHHYQQLAGQLPAYAAQGEGSEFTTAVSVRLLNQLHALRLKLDAADAHLMISCHAPLGERAEEECQRHISTTQGLQRDVETLRTELMRIRDSVQLELKDAGESEKAKYLRSQLDITNQRLVNLDNCCTSHLQRLGALRSLSSDVLRAEDVVKVYEARLTEKETMSLDPQEVLKQQGELKHMRGELQQKQDVLESVVSGLSGVQHLSEPQEQQRCVMGVARYQEQVAQLGERWSRIQGQIRSRLDDLDSYLPQLDRFLRSSSALGEWIGATQQQLETLQATKPDDVKLLNQLLNQQKALNSEIKQKRELLEDVQKDGDVCIGAIKNYEQNLVSYSSGLETLLNIPVKRTVLQSPSSSISEQVSSLTAHYLQLLTRSTDLHKLLMMSLQNTEELKIRNTQIKLLEDERLQLKDAVSEHSVTTSSLQEALLKYQQELSQSQTHLLALEEVKRSQTIKCMATRESLQSSQDQLAALSEEVRSLKLQLEDLERRKKVVEERYAFLQEEHDGAMRKKLKEQEQANWAKMELEKKVSEGGREVERLRKELDGEARRVKEARAELAKVRQEHAAEIREMTNTYESQILVTQSSMQRLSQQQESDSNSVRMEVDKLEEESRDLTEQLQMLRLSLAESDALRKSLEEEVKRLKRLGTEESRKRNELESQLKLALSQKREAENQWKEVQEGSNRASQEKNGEIGQLTRCLEEERRNRRGVEAEVRRLRGELEEAAGKNQALSEELVRLRSSHHQLSLMRVELEAHALEKGRSDQSATRLQARAQELQEELKRLEAELEKQRNAAEEEAGKRRRAETQLEKSSQAMREYTTTITTLRKSQEEADGECRRLQEVLKEQKVSSQALAAARAELETLRGQLGQERERLLDANRRLEEKSEGAAEAEAERLRRQGEAWARERLRLEEELRLQRGDQRLADKMAAMQTQLESSQRADAEHERLIRQLSREREKLQAEIESVQTQARETSSVIQASQSQCVSLQQERDQLLARIQAMQQDAARVKSLDQEMSGLRLSLQTEQKLKAQLEEENHRIKKDFSQWKVQCQSHEEKIRQHGSEQAALESQFCSVRSEMERLRRQLTEAEEQYRLVLERQQVETVSIRHMEVLETQQKPAEPTKVLLDPSCLLFEGVRKTVTAQQLHDCGVIDAATLELLVTGKKSVPDVAVDIKLNLKGTGAIAGLDAGPRGKMTFTEAKKLKLLPEESGRMLLEAQASTGHIIDPRTNVKMSLDEALVSGLVEEGDRKRLATAEAACVGFKDPKTTKVLSANQAMKKGLVERDTALRLLQAQEAAGGVLDPVLSVYLPKDTAMDRDLIDDDLYQALNAKPACYVDPESKAPVSYVTLKKQCKTDPSSGLLLLPAPEKPLTVRGLRREVSLSDLVDAKLLEPSDVDHVKQGTITSQDIEHRLRAYLRGSTCIAGVLDESKDSTLTIYQAMKNGLLRPGTTLELLEAQAASGFIIDPLHNQCFTVEEAVKNGLVGAEFKDKLLSAERAVTGYKDPGTGKKISLFEAMERGLIEKGHGIRLLEAQIASGGIIDPQHSHRIDTDVAYQRGYFDHAMNQILTDEGDDTKGFFDPNTEDNLTYLQLKSRCICDPKSGLVLLPLHDKKKASKRKRRVLIVDPDTNKEMSVREAYESKLIDYQTFLELSQQECEWEERSVTAPDGTTSTAIVDLKNGIHYDLKDLLSKGLIGQDVVDKYRSGSVSLTQLADMITNKMKSQGEPLSSTSSSFTSQTTLTSQTTSQTLTTQTKTVTKAESVSTQLDSSSTGATRHISSMSVKLGPLVESLEEQNPVGAIFDTEKLEKISVSDALKRGVLDSITAQRLLEAQACTGGLVNPESGRRVSIQEATRLGVIDDEMANRLKPAQKAYIGFEEVKTRRMMSAAEAVKEKWLPYEAGQRFLEFQYLTGGLFDPESGSRRSLEEALQLGWLDMRAAQRLQDTRHHPKSLTCPKTKLRISYKEALDACMNEENTGVRMLPAAMVSSRGISSPYNLSNPNSAPGSRSGSRRGSVDHGLSPSSSSRYSSFSYSRTSFSSRSLT